MINNTSKVVHHQVTNNQHFVPKNIPMHQIPASNVYSYEKPNVRFVQKGK